MGWVALIVTLAGFAYSWYRSSRVTSQAQQIQQITGPTAAEGICIPVLFGERTIDSPNTTWYGGQETNVNEDKSVSYKIALQMALCHGKLDSLEAVYVAEADNNNFLSSPVTTDKVVGFNNPVASGTEKVSGTDDIVNFLPGDFSGKFKIRMGAVNIAGAVDAGVTTSADYANTGMGLANGPRYYGVAMVESVEPCYIGKSPQIAGAAFRAKRIHTRKGGSETQWYDAKSEIQFGRNLDDVWKYRLVDGSNDAEYTATDYDDSAWPEGRGGFGNADAQVIMWSYITDAANKYPIPPVKTQLTPDAWPGLCFRDNIGALGVHVAKGAKLWIRGDLGPLPQQDLGVRCWHDDGGFLWFNGVEVTLTPMSDPTSPQVAHFNSTATISAALVNPDGPNVVAFCARDSYKTFWHEDDGSVGTNQFIYGGIQVGLDVSNPRRTSDMNAITAMVEIITDDIWGAGYADAAIGDTFTTAADTCYSEKLGISFLWNDQKSYQDVLEDLQRYVTGYIYVDPVTGKFEIKLVREDYDIEDLPVFDGSNTSTITDIERQAVGQLVNQVTATYSNTPRGKQGSVTVSIPWLIDEQGGIVNQKVDYPAVSNSFIAGRLALRDLRVLSAPLLSCTVGANRDAIDLRPGFPFLLNRPDLGIDNVVMRVAEIDFGDGIKNECTIKCLEDVFYFPAAPTIASNPPIPVIPPTIKIATAADEYDTARAVDPRNKGWVETVFNASWFGPGGTVFSGWTEISPGVMERTSTGPLSSTLFDGLDPFTGMALGSGYTSGSTWAVGRRFFALSGSGDITGSGQQYQGAYVIDDLGWDPVNITDTHARMHRDPAFSSSEQFAKDMIFSVRDGATYGGNFLQLDTANVVLGATEQAWTDLESVTWTDSYKLLKVRELSTQTLSPDSSLRISATTVNGVTAFNAGFETLVGTPGVTSIPAGAWKFNTQVVGISGQSTGSTTLLGFQVYCDSATNPRTLFEALSEPITASRTYPVAIPEILYMAPAITLEAADRLVLIPRMHTTSTTEVTMDLYYNNAYAVHVFIPRPAATTTAPIKPDEAWYVVTVVDGVISNFGNHRKLRVRGTGPLVGIDTSSMTGPGPLTLSFVDSMGLTIDGAPTSGAPITHEDGNSFQVDAGSVQTAYLINDSGSSVYWRLA